MKPLRSRRPRIENLETRCVLSSFAWEAPIDGYGRQIQQEFRVDQNSEDNELSIATTPWYWWGESIDQTQVIEVGDAEFGSVTLEDDGSVNFTPASDFLGVDSFEVEYEPANGESTTATVYVNVTESIFALPDWHRVPLDIGANEIDVLANDYRSSPDAVVEIVEVSATRNGAATISEDDKSILYRAEVGFEGVDEFTYTTVDRLGNRSSSLVSVEVTSDFDVPHYTNASHARYDDLANLVRQHATTFGQRQSHWYPHFAHDILVTSSVPVTATSLSLSNRLSNESATNIQVDGVDEGDIVKRHGDELFIASGNRLRIVDIRVPNQPKLLETISFDDTIVDLYAFGERVTVISETSPQYLRIYNPTELYDYEPPTYTVSVLDVSDPTSVASVYSSEIEGNYRHSRLVDGMLYVISGREGRHIPLEKDSSGRFTESISQFVSRVEGTLAAPSYSLNGSTIQLAWTDLPIDATGTGLTAIFTFDTLGDSETPVDVDLANTGWGSNIYVSDQAIYLLSYATKSFSSNSLRTTDSLSEPNTQILKFAFESNGQGVEFIAKGHVTGYLSDQFSADENDGYFRIATTTYGSQVDLHVLEQNGDELGVVGSLKDIAPHERIYSTRFDGDRAFITTYRKVDPLFVIDLSNPETPTIEGELKIPSYSNYMQVINEDYVLGIGRDANDGLFDGLQVSLFNVADPNDPRLVGKYEFEGGRNTWSPIADAWNLLDHHAVTFIAEHGILAMPTYTSSWWGSGAHGEDHAISLLKIDFENETVDLVSKLEFEEVALRSLQVDEYLYGISESSIQVVGLDALEQVVKTLDLETGVVTTHEDQLPKNDNTDRESQSENTENPSSQQASTIAPLSTLLQPMDVNSDGALSAIDALVLTNLANEFGFAEIDLDTHSHADTNQDGQFSPVDLVIVINELNELADDNRAEGESLDWTGEGNEIEPSLLLVAPNLDQVSLQDADERRKRIFGS